jgi:hypothetical protein
MAHIHKQFNMQGVQYEEIHFKLTAFAKDLIAHCFRDGVEISREAYEEAKAEYRKLWMAAHR